MRINHRRDYDLPRLIQRRRLLQLAAGSSMIALAGCAPDEGSTEPASSTTPSTTPSPSASPSPAPGPMAGERFPEETAGPYPADGSNGPNVLTQSGIVRSDITSSFGSSTSVAEGEPLDIDIYLSTPDGGVPVGAAVYLWHCDREGNYSMYTESVIDENYPAASRKPTRAAGLLSPPSTPAATQAAGPH